MLRIAQPTQAFAAVIRTVATTAGTVSRAFGMAITATTIKTITKKAIA